MWVDRLQQEVKVQYRLCVIMTPSGQNLLKILIPIDFDLKHHSDHHRNDIPQYQTKVGYDQHSLIVRFKTIITSLEEK